jgi:hypothetical protein
MLQIACEIVKTVSYNISFEILIAWGLFSHIQAELCFWKINISISTNSISLTTGMTFKIHDQDCLKNILSIELSVWNLVTFLGIDSQDAVDWHISMSNWILITIWQEIYIKMIGTLTDLRTSLSATGITRCSAWVHLGNINYDYGN